MSTESATTSQGGETAFAPADLRMGAMLDIPVFECRRPTTSPERMWPELRRYGHFPPSHSIGLKPPGSLNGKAGGSPAGR